MQLVDELSMIYTTCTTFYAIFSHGQSKSNAILLFVFTVSLAAFITGYYHFLQNPVFHQNIFALLTAIVFIRSMYVMNVNLRSSIQVNECTSPQPHAISYASTSEEVSGVEVEQEQARMGNRDAEILRKMWKMIACGLSVVLGGFIIWNLDNIFCPTLRRWRRGIGLPWGIVLEGHGWW
jgi:dihydroceramidase